MAVIQITKIQIRRGNQADLLPTSLDSGEFGFAQDSGRLFLGTDPTGPTGLWSGRALSPYENIEVLTESSTDTFARLFDRMHRTTGPVGLTEATANRKPYLVATLAASTSSWTHVQVERIDPATGLYDAGILEDVVLSQTVSVGARIEYFLFQGTDLVRSGVLIVNNDGSADESQLVDESTSRAEISTGSTAVSASSAYLSGVQFRAMHYLVGGVDRIYLEFKNTTATPCTMQFRIVSAAL